VLITSQNVSADAPGADPTAIPEGAVPCQRGVCGVLAGVLGAGLASPASLIAAMSVPSGRAGPRTRRSPAAGGVLETPAGAGSAAPVGDRGTVVGSLTWCWLGDRIGRRASILLAAVHFTTTAICGTMPGFSWNLLMCFLRAWVPEGCCRSRSR
jgi:MFS family permease